MIKPKKYFIKPFKVYIKLYDVQLQEQDTGSYSWFLEETLIILALQIISIFNHGSIERYGSDKTLQKLFNYQEEILLGKNFGVGIMCQFDRF